MEQIAQVQKVLEDGTAEVIRLPEESCSGNCAMCGGCKEQVPFVVRNPIDAVPGSRVVLEPDPKLARKTLLLLCTIPTVLLLAGYLLGEHLLGKGPLVGLACGVLGLWLVMALDKRMTRKYSITYIITDYAEEKTA